MSNQNNRWVKKAAMIPWGEIEKRYAGLDLCVQIRSDKSDFFEIIHVVTNNIIYVGGGHFSGQQISHRIHVPAQKELFFEFFIIKRQALFNKIM